MWIVAVIACAYAVPSAALGARSDSEPALGQALDGALRGSGAPGAQAAVVVHGVVVWEGAAGTTAPSGGAPITGATVFSIASATKTYTAALTLKLVQEGDLRLQDTVGQWLGDAVPAPERSTEVRELLQMTSGIPDYLTAPALAKAFEDPHHHWTLRELLAVLQPPRRRGTFDYSNSNYILLGALDARAGGEPVAKLLRRTVLGPMGLEGTFLSRRRSVARRFTPGWELLSSGRLVDAFPADGFVPTDVWGPLFTDGGIATTASELARFANGLFSGSLLSGSLLATMIQPGPDGEYGMGTFSYRFDGHLWQGHDGAFAGFSSDDFTDLNRGVTVAVLANGMSRVGETDPADVIWRSLARAFDLTGPA